MRPERRTILYWTTQVVAWGSYVGLFLVLSYLDRTLTPQLIAVNAAVFAVGISAGHAFRHVCLTQRWLDRPLGSVLPRTVLLSALLGALATVVEGGFREMFLGHDAALLSGPTVRLFSHWVNWVLLLVLWGLAYLAYNYLARSRTEQIRTLRLETAARDNQLNNLRAQMNPHFMFNALNGIRALIDEDPGQAKQAITQLSAILRNAMNTVKRKVVPLGEEVDIVKAYLALETMRYEERLRITYCIPPELDREMVPPMLLQTLVENAVRHGIAPLRDGGDLEVSAEAGPNGLRLTVVNSGTYHPGRINGSGIGLRNTRKRLELLYGNQAHISIENMDEKVLTRVDIPRELSEPTIDKPK